MITVITTEGIVEISFKKKEIPVIVNMWNVLSVSASGDELTLIKERFTYIPMYTGNTGAWLQDIKVPVTWYGDMAKFVLTGFYRVFKVTCPDCPNGYYTYKEV